MSYSRTYNTSDNEVKIKALAKGTAANEHFHNIDYKISLAQNLYPKRTFSFGALTNVDWYSDQALTDKVITVDISYNYNALGFATDRTVTRTWYRPDGSAHPETKVTYKDYTINPQDQLDEAIKRRQNNKRQTDLWLIGNVPALTAADANIPDKTAEEIRNDGTAFYTEHSAELTSYIEAASTTLEDAVIASGNDAWNAPSTGWFNADATSLGITGVADVRDYIVYQLSNGQRNKNGDIV